MKDCDARDSFQQLYYHQCGMEEVAEKLASNISMNGLNNRNYMNTQAGWDRIRERRY